MSSNLRASTWSLSARLLVGQVLLLAAVCVGIGAVTLGALYQYLAGEVDAQLRETAHRSAMMFGVPVGLSAFTRSTQDLRSSPGA